MAPADANAWRRDRPLNVARAGGDLEAPEHTLYACQQALAAGADALHLDLRLTGDDQVVLLTDGTVDRTTDGSGEIERFSLGELKHLDPAYRFRPGQETAGDGKVDMYPLRGVATGDRPPPDGVSPEALQIPTLSEILDVLPTPRLVLRLHDHSRRKGMLARRIVERLEARQAIERALVTPHNDVSARILRRKAPNLDLAWPTAQLVVRGDRGMATDLHVPAYEAVHLPLEHAGRPIITPELVDDLHASRMALFVHRADEEPAMQRCFELGVDGIVTGRPSLLAGVLDR